MWFWNLLWWVLGLCILVPSWLYLVYIFFKFLFSPIRYILEKNEESRRRKEEEKKEREYQEALARWDLTAKVSKETYFIAKSAEEFAKSIEEREAKKKWDDVPPKKEKPFDKKAYDKKCRKVMRVGVAIPLVFLVWGLIILLWWWISTL